MHDASFRAKLLARRTYQRPLDGGGHETWAQMCDRVCDHQEWLWERALGRPLELEEKNELLDLYRLMVERKALPAGRILWMGGTEQVKKTEIAMFNCSFAVVRDVYSAVDAYYLLLNGCGVGFKPEAGLLNGFAKHCEVEVKRSCRNDKGSEDNTDFFFTSTEGYRTWHLTIGDSGVAWAKAFGKLLAMKKPVDRIVLDFREIRPAGSLLAGYGWLSSGDQQIADAFVKICKILNDRAGQLLDEIDIVDLINLVGTTLTSRRSAEIAMLEANNVNAERFATMKENHHAKAPWRSQSNNSLVFYSRPSKLELRGVFAQMLEAGGSEPGLYNGENARRRAPWFSGTNPCGEILLGDGGLCNLVDLDLGKFTDDWEGLLEALRLIARANYRQTCVNLKDGTLSAKWHETQEFLRLCGVGLTGIVKWLDATSVERGPERSLQVLRSVAHSSAKEMATELGLPEPKAVTTVKPSGTVGKVMDTTEGLHRPRGRYIFNLVKFHISDDILPALRDAGYRITPDPYSDHNVLVNLPVDNGPGKWTVVDGAEVNMESAVEQLERYKLLMDNYVDHNASVTISYDPGEVNDIVEWLYTNWDSYVGVSFILRTDPTKTAADLGFPYLPQQVVGEREYLDYVSSLSEVDLVGSTLLETDECAGGSCPVR